MKKRHSIRLYEYYKSYNKFFKENKIKILEEDIDKYYKEFSSSKSLKQFPKDSEKFFDYLINRFHMLLVFDMFDYLIPFEYKGQKATYEFEPITNQYIGYVNNDVENDIYGKTIAEIEQDFHNFVDLVLKVD